MEIGGNFLLKKIMILGIIFLAAIAVALIPSPGNFSYPLDQSNSAAASKPADTVQLIGATVNPVRTVNNVIFEPSNQTSTQPVNQTKTHSAIDPTPEPVHASITIIPPVPEGVVLSVNQTFKVEIWVNNVTNMAGWQIDLLWNRDVFKCLQAQVNTPPEWGGVGFDWFNKTASDVDPNGVDVAWQFGSGINNTYSTKFGVYFKAECYAPRGSPYHTVFNGSIPVVTLTFQAIRPGPCDMSFDGVLIGDGRANPIACTVNDWFVQVELLSQLRLKIPS
jgi:hypothetical protein